MTPCPGPTRRRVIQFGAAAPLGLALPGLLRARAAAPARTARADACILIFLNGGPSHLDTWDMKPDAPAEVRGEFRPAASSLPGLRVCEHLPRFARHMHRCTLVRSAHHSVNNAHAAAVYTGLTGHDRGDANRLVAAGPDDLPAIGSVVGVQRPPDAPVVPYVAMPFVTQEGAGGPPQPGFFGGVLGRARDPMWVLRDPNAADFALPELSPGAEMPPARLAGRRDLAGRLRGPGPAAADMDAFQARAFDLLTSAATREAFRLDREPPASRDAYGRNVYGQSVLLARRLVEAGCRVACISWAPHANATWDTHGQNFAKLKGELLPQLDLAFSALVSDLVDRGMFDRTLVAVMGEFGRSPRVNGAAGRDHWNFCYSLVLAGGGVRAGHVHGSSDRIGGRPSDLPVTPADVVATIYECLGVPPDLEVRDRLGRPQTLVPGGRPIAGVLA